MTPDNVARLYRALAKVIREDTLIDCVREDVTALARGLDALGVRAPEVSP